VVTICCATEYRLRCAVLCDPRPAQLGKRATLHACVTPSPPGVTEVTFREIVCRCHDRSQSSCGGDRDVRTEKPPGPHRPAHPLDCRPAFNSPGVSPVDGRIWPPPLLSSTT